MNRIRPLIMLAALSVLVACNGSSGTDSGNGNPADTGAVWDQSHWDEGRWH